MKKGVLCIFEWWVPNTHYALGVGVIGDKIRKRGC